MLGNLAEADDVADHALSEPHLTLLVHDSMADTLQLAPRCKVGLVPVDLLLLTEVLLPVDLLHLLAACRSDCPDRI